jgi:hypothetical protein
VVEVAEVMAVAERRTRWAAADTLVAVRAWVAAGTSEAAACVLAVHLMLAALRAWVAAAEHISEAARISARVISAADKRDRISAAGQRDRDLLRGPVSMLSASTLSIRSQHTAQTETPSSIVEMAKRQASAEAGMQV